MITSWASLRTHYDGVLIFFCLAEEHLAFVSFSTNSPMIKLDMFQVRHTSYNFFAVCQDMLTFLQRFGLGPSVKSQQLFQKLYEPQKSTKSLSNVSLLTT